MKADKFERLQPGDPFVFIGEFSPACVPGEHAEIMRGATKYRFCIVTASPKTLEMTFMDRHTPAAESGE